MTLFRLYTEGSRMLKQTGNPDAENDARLLLLAAFQLDQVHYLLNRMQDLPENDFNNSSTKLYYSMLEKRRKRYPLQQILGNQEFMGFSFLVNKDVLIPRQDTETLVELVLQEQRDAGSSLLDVCTGSGCIAISLAIKGGYCEVIGTDISKAALAVARKNAETLCKEAGKQSIHFLEGDLFHALEEQLEEHKQFDIITSNPPYIPTAVIATLEPEVRQFEPMLALDGTEDGLHYYRILAKEAKNYLKEHGTIYMEIGHDQGEAVSGLFELESYQNVRVVKDLQGNDRVVCAVRG